MVDQVRQTQPEHLERLIPLPVPVGVGDYVQMESAIWINLFHFAPGNGDAMTLAAGIQMSL